MADQIVKYYSDPKINGKTVISYRSIDVFPSISEITVSFQKVYLNRNQTVGKFESAHQYLSIQFRLLREDFIAPLRRTICSLIKVKGASTSDEMSVFLFENIRLHYYKENLYFLSFKSNSKTEVEDLFKETSKRFMTGALLLFTRNNFKTFFCGTVSRKCQTSKQIYVQITKTPPEPSFYRMAESKVFFEPYHKVLKVLQQFADDVPMERYILGSSRRISSARYLDSDHNDLTKLNRAFSLLQTRTESVFKFNLERGKLNNSQKIAYKAATENEFTLIQGPPGTGKTYVLVEIVKALLTKRHLWFHDTPMLIISSSNHALDQFLERILPYTNCILRAGNQSKSKLLEPYKIKSKADAFRLECGYDCDYYGLMRTHLVVGMTTTKAASLECSNATLTRLQSPIVIIEEAAEILEAHVVACLTKYCQQLILIGDHKQLQPNTSDHRVGTEFGLGISLFERMINNGVPYYTLNVQHRMNPEISDLLVPTIYKTLDNDDSVKIREPIKGFTTNIFFLTHENRESSGTGSSSKMNVHEAKMIVHLARYLSKLGYPSSSIVILAAYLAQTRRIQEDMKRCPGLEGIRIETVDSFQGEEADIILLSLVRNNAEGNVGFLSKENRICVALSRARKGLYIMGNIHQLKQKSKVSFWNCVE